MTPEDFLREFGHLAETEGGIAQLRAAVHQLAIAGKLVPQDRSEGSARAFLEQMVEVFPKREWTRWELPDGWHPCLLEDVCCQVQYGVTAKAVDTRDGPRMLRITDIQDDTVDWDTVPGCDIDDSAARKASLSDGDILIARTGGTIGKTYLVSNLDRHAVFASYLIRAVPHTPLLSPYLKVFAGSGLYWEQLRAGTAGTGLPNVSGSTLKRLAIPLPPLPEQKRIVEKVDQLMALCDELEEGQKKKRSTVVALGKSALNAVVSSSDASALKDSWKRVQDNFEVMFDLPENVKELRQTILQLAFAGRLTTQRPEDGTAADVLSRFGEVPLAAEQDLPEGWALVTLPMVAEQRLGKMLDKAKNRGAPRPYLRNLNVQWFRFALDDVLEMRLEDKEVEEFLLRDGDLLVCEGGEPGRAAIWRDRGAPMYFQKALHRVRPFAGVMPELLAYRFRLDTWSGELATLFTGATIKHLTGQALRLHKFPLPPPAEQRRIVAKVDQLMLLCDDLELRLAQHRGQGQRLVQAVVEGLVA